MFTADGCREYAENLLVRMVNPFLTDSVERVCRDLERKLGWDDRIIGTMRVVVAQGFQPIELARGASIAAKRLFGSDPANLRQELARLWPAPWTEEHKNLLTGRKRDE